MSQVVLFICPHGAAKSRIAAAFFNRVAPPGWVAISAGQEPQAELGVTAIRLLAGSEAEAWLDHEPPRPIEAVAEPAHLVAIDCQVPEAETWTLTQREINQTLRDELQDRAEALAY